MATITPAAIDTAGEAVTYVAASGGGDTVACGTSHTPTTLRVKNGAVSPITVTLTGVVPCSQGSTHNKTYTVAAGAESAIDVPAQCINPTTGHCAVGYSAVTTVTVAATQ